MVSPICACQVAELLFRPDGLLGGSWAGGSQYTMLVTGWVVGWKLEILKSSGYDFHQIQVDIRCLRAVGASGIHSWLCTFALKLKTQEILPSNLQEAFWSLKSHFQRFQRSPSLTQFFMGNIFCFIHFFDFLNKKRRILYFLTIDGVIMCNNDIISFFAGRGQAA